MRLTRGCRRLVLRAPSGRAAAKRLNRHVGRTRDTGFGKLRAIVVDFREELKRLLRDNPDYGLAENEWAAVLKLLQSAPEEKEIVLRWILAEYAGFVETRANAGRELLRINQQLAWRTLESLTLSRDPDDRDTALALLGQSGHPKANELLKPLLEDDYPYIQLDAIDQLQETYPAEARAALLKLAHHDIQAIKEAAAQRLNRLNSNQESQGNAQ